MLERMIGDRNLELLRKGMEGTRMRHSAILQNLANIETPGYKRKVVYFEEGLRQALRRRAAGIEDYHPVAVEDDSSQLRGDGNTVDIDKESVELAQNTLRYMAILDIVNRSFSGMKKAMQPSS